MQLQNLKPFNKKKKILMEWREKIYKQISRAIFNIEDFNKTKVYVAITQLLNKTDYDEVQECFVDMDNNPLPLVFFIQAIRVEITHNRKYLT